MAADSTINVKIFGDASKFKRAVGDAGSKLAGFGNKTARIAGDVAKGFAVMGAAAGGLSIVVGRELFNTGQELVSLDQKIGTVFSGQSAERVSAWADTVAARMGLTSTQAQGLAANAGDLLKPMGFTADQAADMSTEIIGLSGALSEWSGGQRSVEETAEILSKALLGERDSLKSLGISINQAEVDQRALTIAQEDGRAAIEQTDRALATQQLILEKSTDAQQAYLEGGNNLIGAQNRLKARFGELKEELARKLLPVFDDMATQVVNLLEVFDERGLAGVIDEVKDRVAAAWPDIKAKLAIWGSGFVAWLEEMAPPFFTALGQFLVKFGRWFIDDALPVIRRKLGQWAQALVDWVVKAWPGTRARLKQWAKDVFAWVKENAPRLGTALKPWGTKLAEWITGSVFPAIVELNKMLLRLGKWIITDGVVMLGKALDRWIPLFANAIAKGLQTIVKGAPSMMKRVAGWFATDGVRYLLISGLLLGSALYRGLREAFTAAVDGLKDIGRNIVNNIAQGIREAPNAIKSALESLLPGSGGFLGSVVQAASGNIFPRAAGGPVLGGTPYMVGESGPELFVPTGSGTIVNNNRLGGMGGGGMNVTVNMPVGSDGADVVAALQRYARAHGGSVPILTGQL